MRHLLLDTHTFLWFTEGDPQLSPLARTLITDSANIKYVSVASLWEIAIKVSLGKLVLSMSLPDLFAVGLEGNGLLVLPIEKGHILNVGMLPFHHRDPFDRLLAAQCLEEQMSLVSRDVAFDIYGVTRLW